MKQIIVAFALIGVVAVLMIWNGFYLTAVCGELLDMCNKLPENKQEFENLSPQQAEDILEKFKGNTVYMNLSLPFPEIREADRAITDVISYIRTRNYDEYIAARARSILTLEILRGYEVPNIEHLL